MAELDRLRDEMAQDILPLSRRLSELEQELSDVRLEHQDVSRQLDRRLLNISNLRRDIELRREDATYLSNLLAEYIPWFVVQSVLGTAVAVRVIDGLRRHPLVGFSLRDVTADFTIVAGLAGSVLLLALAIPVFSALLDLRRWARLLLLIVGWITVLGAVSSLLAMSGSAALARPLMDVRPSDWRTIQLTCLVTKTIDLAFWSWVIYTLQANALIRDAFLSTSTSHPSTQSRC